MALEGKDLVNYPCIVLAGLLGKLNDAMAHQAWVTTSSRWCEMVQAEAELMESRVYPAEVIPDFPRYQIAARKCSYGTACNLAGFPCKWAYNETGNDPFEPTV
ncbi:MAG TPA: hypothetical protein DEP47_10850 [Chloroflexi bacterium]|nr:hypothetical protein [Chloroflexota bacterium]